MPSIKVACEGAKSVPLGYLLHFQGNLKDLSQSNFEKAKKSLVELGFSEPFSVWQNDGKMHILNGHQRLRVLQTLEKEGWKIPELPISLVHAKNIGEAKRKVLALTSQYGEMTKQGLYEFMMTDMDMQPEELNSMFAFSDVNLPNFMEEFFKDSGDSGDVSKMQADGDVERTLGSASSHVRMVQLFFNDENHPEFITKMEAVAKIYGKDNLTDNIMEMLREVHSLKFSN